MDISIVYVCVGSVIHQDALNVKLYFLRSWRTPRCYLSDMRSQSEADRGLNRTILTHNAQQYSCVRCLPGNLKRDKEVGTMDECR